MKNKENESLEIMIQKARTKIIVSKICTVITLILFGVNFVIISSAPLIGIEIIYIFSLILIFFGLGLIFKYLGRKTMSRYRKMNAEQIIAQYPNIYNEKIDKHTQDFDNHQIYDEGIHVSTFCTYEVFQEFYHFSFFKSKYYSTIKTLVMVVIPILILYLFKLSLSAIAISLAVVFIAVVYSYFSLPKQTFNAQMSMLYGNREFSFGNEEFRVISISSGNSFNAIYQYKNLYKIYETEDFIYIFTTKFSAHIVRKADIFGYKDELIHLLSGRLGDKYVKCR